MARHVEISTIGAAPPRLLPGARTPQLIRRMREFWHEKIAQVLPDRPDLIVLPAYCDVYADRSCTERQEYARRANKTIYVRALFRTRIEIKTLL
jgi:hypothetical protein